MVGGNMSEEVTSQGQPSAHPATHHILDALARDSCGYTLDLHRGNGGGNVVQWLWAHPVSESDVDDSTVVTERANGVSQQLRGLGLTPGTVAPYVIQLDDEVGLLAECPFQPMACAGPHIVASGSGLLPHAQAHV